MTDAVNFKDWVLGRGEFSEENLKKARQEFFDDMAARTHAKVMQAVEAALDGNRESPGEGYRWLHPAETIKEGDEFYCDRRWLPATRWGALADSYHQYRRRYSGYDAAPVAQLAEQPFCERPATGSSPVGGSLDAGPEAKANGQGRDNPDTPDHVGTGNTQQPKPFVLERDVDVSGVSGTGVVAQGVEFADGTVALRWTSQWPTSVVFHERGIEAVLAVHGHSGATRLVWGSQCHDFAGNTQEPALWAVFLKDGSVSSVYWKKPEYRNTVPLYRSPQPTLTDEEREAIRYFAHFFPVCAAEIDAASAILRTLLERLK